MNYADKIKDSVDWLLESEKKRGIALDRDHCHFLRLLKSGECKSQAAAGLLVYIPVISFFPFKFT